MNTQAATTAAVSASRFSTPTPEPGEALDDEEVFEFEQPNSSNSYLSVSPFNQQFEQTTYPSDRDYARQVAAAHAAPRCGHVKASGVGCKAPALRGARYCYFHHRLHAGPRLIYPTLTQLEDAHGVQNAIMEVLTGILELRIDNRTAGLLLYGLQTAMANLKRLAEVDPDEVVLEPPEPDRTQDGAILVEAQPDPFGWRQGQEEGQSPESMGERSPLRGDWPDETSGATQLRHETSGPTQRFGDARTGGSGVLDSSAARV